MMKSGGPMGLAETTRDRPSWWEWIRVSSRSKIRIFFERKSLKWKQKHQFEFTKKNRKAKTYSIDGLIMFEEDNCNIWQIEIR